MPTLRRRICLRGYNVFRSDQLVASVAAPRKSESPVLSEYWSSSLLHRSWKIFTGRRMTILKFNHMILKSKCDRVLLLSIPKSADVFDCELHGCSKDLVFPDTSTAKQRSPLCSNLSSNGGLTSEIISTTMEEAESKKFVIDLNVRHLFSACFYPEPPPMESTLEGEEFERLTVDSKVVFKAATNLDTKDATTKRSAKTKREIRDRDLDLESLDDIMNGSLGSGRMMQQFPLEQVIIGVNGGQVC